MSAGSNTAESYGNETRFALMEQSIQHMNQKLEQSIQHMNQKLDQSIQQINQTFQRIETRFDKLDDEIKEVKVDVNDVQKELKSEIRSNFFWTLGVIGAFIAVMAHGFHWL
jgi:flagellar hook-associated protein FlgK